MFEITPLVGILPSYPATGPLEESQPLLSTDTRLLSTYHAQHSLCLTDVSPSKSYHKNAALPLYMDSSGFDWIPSALPREYINVRSKVYAA